MVDPVPINDLQALLASMDPALDTRTFVFVTGVDELDPAVLARAIMVFREEEGLSAILEESIAHALGIEGTFACRRVTLRVRSALDAVGFLARILPELAKAGMGVNPVSAFHHDHLFVPADRANDALNILRDLAASAREPSC